MENTSDNQEKEKKTRVGRKKVVVTVIGVGAVLVAAGVAGTMYYRQTQSSTTQENGGLWGHQNGKNMNENLVTASGTTSIGVDAVTFAIDFLEDTSLYVEEVYVSSGDEVEAEFLRNRYTDSCNRFQCHIGYFQSCQFYCTVQAINNIIRQEGCNHIST